MVAICCCFEVHQPFRLRPGFNAFSIGSAESCEDDARNREIFKRVAERCYLPVNALLLELIGRHAGRFHVAFSISGVALEQCERYEPRVLEGFRRLARTGCVEFLAGTYHHSLASVFSEAEFRHQVRLHKRKIRELLGVAPTILCNTELTYDDRLGGIACELGYEGVMADAGELEAARRSANHVYESAGDQPVPLLLRNRRLSDDVALRFADRHWREWPLDADKFAAWLDRGAEDGEVVTLVMPYETLGEHHGEQTGILNFIRHLPAAVLARGEHAFLTPAEVLRTHRPVARLSVPRRDLAAWLGNEMQADAARRIFGMEKQVLATRDAGVADLWRRLTTSDHLLYMDTRCFEDGQVKGHANPYDSPYDAYIHLSNAIGQLQHLTSAAHDRALSARRARRRAAEAASALPRVAPRRPTLVPPAPAPTIH